MKYIFFTTVEVEAENEDDARIELLGIMDAHAISWDLEEQEQPNG